MLEGVLASVLNRFLASYVDGLNTNQLNVAIWSGDVKLRNLRLKRSALDKLRLPIDVKEGYLGQLTLTIPWSNIKGKSVRMLIENVSLLAVPRDASVPVDEAEEDERQQALKQQKLIQSELLYSGALEKTEEDAQKTESFMSSLFTRIVDNVQVTVRNIHIRYEDALSSPEHPFSLGITLAELSAVSTDGNWEPTFVHNSASGIHKLARLDSLSIYWDAGTEFLTTTSSEDLQQKLNELIASKDHVPEHQYVLQPVSGVGKFVMRRRATKEQAKMDAQLVFDQIGLTLSDEQYSDALSMLNLFSFYARQAQYQSFRPTAEELETNRPLAMFRFAARAIVNEMHQRRRVWTWEYMRERRDLRREYVLLFKAKELAEQQTAEGQLIPTSGRLRELENKLDLRDIRFFRSIARRQLRKERLEAAQDAEALHAPPKPASSSRGWLGWMWGSGASDAKDASPVLNKAQRKELFDAIEWDEKTGQSLRAPFEELPPDVVNLHVTAKLNRGLLALKDHRAGQPVMSLMFDNLQGEMSQRPHNFDTSVTLGALRVEDGTNDESQFREIVRVKDRGDDDDSSMPLLYMRFEHNPLDGRADNALQLRTRSLEIVYHASYLESIMHFFKPPESELELIGALLDVASSTLEGLRRETRAGLENALENHKTIDLVLDIQSPIWVIPEDVTTRDGRLLMLDAGHLAMRSLLAEPQTMDMIRAKHFRQYTEEDFRQLEELMYDRYILKLDDVQLVLGDGYEACMHSLQVRDERELHLLERINLSFTLHNSILPRAPNLTKFKVTGTLPSLRVHFSDNKYRALLQLIQVAIPGTGSSSTSRSEATASVSVPQESVRRLGEVSEAAPPDTLRVPSDAAPSGQTGTRAATQVFNPLQARRERLAEQMRGDADQLLLTDDDSSASSDDSRSEHDAETYEESQITDSSELLTAQQKTFEFDLVVDEVSGTVSKSGATTKEDQLLAEAVFQHFRLGVYVTKHKLQVDVHLGSLDLVDCVVEQAPMFRHMITSRPLESTTGRAEKPEADAHDLIFVQYTHVSPTAPDFHEQYDGIESSLNVNLSTINLMITRVTVLTVYDWILQTFVNGSDEQDDDSDEADDPTKMDDDDVSLVKTPQTAIGSPVPARRLSLPQSQPRSKSQPVKVPDDVAVAGGPAKASHYAADDTSSPASTSKTRIRIKLSSILLRLNDDGALLSTLTFSTADIALLLRANTMRVAARVGSLSLLDERQRERADPSFAKLLSIEGNELVDFALETFCPHDAQYPGYDTSIWLRCNTLKLIFVPEPYADLLAYFAKFAKMKAVYDAAKDAASAQASQLQASHSLTRYDVLVKTPIVVMPHDLRTNDQMTGYLGELYAHNTFAAKDDTTESVLHAGLRQIRLMTCMETEEYDGVHELTLLEDVDIAFKITERAPMARGSAAQTPTAPAKPSQDTLELSAQMTDINVKLTQRQYILALALVRSLSVLSMPDDTDVLPTDIVPEEDAARALETVEAQTPAEPGPLRKLVGQFSLNKVRLDLYDETAIHVDSLEQASLFCFTIEDTVLKMHQHPETGMEVEVDVRTFSVTDTRKSRDTHFREIFPAISTKGMQQFMLNYTVSPPPECHALVVVTVDSPKLIFSLDPLFALVAFVSSGLDDEPESTDSKPKAAMAGGTVKSVRRGLPPTAASMRATRAPYAINMDTMPQAPSTSTSTATANSTAAAASSSASAAPGTSFRVNVVEPRIILLSSPTRPDSEAIVLQMRQVVLSQQTILALSLTQLGMFVWRMNSPNDRQRLLSNLDVSLSMDSRMTPSGKITSVEIDMGRLYVRLTRSDIELLVSVVSNAMALSKPDTDVDSTSLASTKAAAAKPAPKRTEPARKGPTPSVLNKLADAFEDDGQVLFSREELTVRGAGLQCILISELHMLPVLDLDVSPFKLLLNDWSADMRMSTELDLGLNNFNLATSNWEPLVEPWTVSLRYERNLAPESSTFTISSGKRLEVNIAAQLIDTTTNMFMYLDQDNRLKEEARHMAPFRIRNRTGYRLTIWSETPYGSTTSSASSSSGTARNAPHHLDDGHDMPWTFSDWRTIREQTTEATYNRLAVHVDDMPWERVRHIAVDREGEYVMTLRPKLNRVSHRLLCEVKLVNNIKVITFQSTFRIDNRALIPFEVGLLDEQGQVTSSILRIEPETYSALPICDAYDRRIKVRPDPGLGYAWSNESVGWQDLLATASHTFVCPALDEREAPFQFQAFAIHDAQTMSRRNYPRVTLAIRAPVEIENVLPYDIHYRLFDKNLNLNWSGFLRRGGVSPVHVVALQHLLLLSVELEDSVYSPSEFAIIASDNPDDFQVESTLSLADESNLKLELRLHYHTYPDSGGAFKVQIYAPYIFLNLSQLPVTIKSRPWAGHSKIVAGQDLHEKDYDASEHSKPFLLSRLRESNNRFMLRTTDSSWSKPLSFDVIGSEVGVAIPSVNGDLELQLGLDIEDGLAKFKLSKVVKLAPRYLIHNLLPFAVRLAESQGGDPILIDAGDRVPLHWLHVASNKHATIAYHDAASEWTAPFSIDNIGFVYLRLIQHNEPQQLVQVDVQVHGPTVFVRLMPSSGAWPFLLRNETQHTVVFMQTASPTESQRSTRDTNPKRYVLKPRSKMKYAWDYPADPDKYIRLQINGSERVINILEIGSLLPFKFAARDNLSAGVVSLDVRADETTQTLVISDYTESKSNFKLLRDTGAAPGVGTVAAANAGHGSPGGDIRFKAVDIDTSILFAFNIELTGLGISLISSKVREIAYMTFRGLELSYSESQVTTAVNVICKWIQIDNQTLHGIFPIVLYPTVVPKDGKELDVHPTLQASVIRKKDESHGVQHIKYASVLLQELTTEIDEDFLFAVYDFVRASSVRAEKEFDETVYIEYPDTIPEPPTQATSSQQVYIEILHLQPIALNLSFMSTDHDEADETESSRTLFFYIFNMLTMVLGNVNEAPVRLNALVIENVRLSKDVLLNRVAYHYGQGVLFQVHRILGSADFLGNPVGLFNNVSSGVADMFYEPYYGLIMHGNRELGFGIARGASNFVKKTVFGVSDSVSKLTGSISKGLAAVTMDRDFQSRWRAKRFRNKPKHAFYGIAAGANSFLTSVASGIEGLALRPLEGAEDGGASGFMQGLGRGLVGALTKPAAGAFDMASSITEGLRNTTLVFEQNSIDRVRLPRFIASDHVVRPFSEREALGQMWLQTMDAGRLVRDEYVAHINTPGPHGGATIMLTETRILYVRTAHLKALWEVVWSDLSTISLESNGISLVLRGGVLGPYLTIPEESTRLWLFRQVSGVVQKYNAAHA